MAGTTLSRIADILRANVNGLLDQLEDPEKMVRQMLRDMEAEVERAVAAVGSVVANHRRLTREREQHLDRGRHLQERATAALAAGDEELARRALEGRIHAERAAADLAAAIAEGDATEAQLRARVLALRKELEGARNRQGTLIARIRASRGAVPGGDDGPSGDPFADFQRLERRLEHSRGEFERLRRRVERTDSVDAATAEVRRDLLDRDAVLGRRLADMELRQRVDRELADLRTAPTRPEEQEALR